MFLALLVALMITRAPRLQKGPRELKKAQLELQLSRSERQIGELERIGRVQQSRIGKLGATVPGLIAKRRSLTATRRRLRKQCTDLQDAIRAGEETAATAESRLKSLASDLAAAEEERQSAHIVLDIETRRRVARARVSEVRATDKKEIGLVLRYDRLYVWHRYDTAGNRLGLNTDEFVVLQEHAGCIETAPRPDAGILAVGPGAEERIRQRLARFDPDTDYMAIGVWPDSFDSFQSVKSVLVNEGFQYRLLPIVSVLLDRGGKGSIVQ